MPVVSNTSPVSNLAIIDRLDILRKRYGRVLIPLAVKAELGALSHPEGQSRIAQAMLDGWLELVTLPMVASTIAIPVDLDPGETEAIRLCIHLSAEKIILDDSLARAAARSLGLKHTGLLGELVFAKARGWLSSVKVEIGRLRSEARFFVSAEVEAAILAGAGE